MDKSFKNLIPGDGTTVATNLEILRKEINNDLLGSENRTENIIRNATIEIKSHQKTQPKQTGNGSPIIGAMADMALPVVEFSREGYKIRRFLAKNQLYSNEITKFWKLE